MALTKNALSTTGFCCLTCTKKVWFSPNGSQKESIQGTSETSIVPKFSKAISGLILQKTSCSFCCQYTIVVAAFLLNWQGSMSACQPRQLADYVYWTFCWWFVDVVVVLLHTLGCIMFGLSNEHGRYFLLLLHCKSSIWFTEKHIFKIIIYFLNT